MRRKYLHARKWYIETDETFKYIHILEAVNYVRVAEMPKVFFEFGCHSGRTFSAAILASKFLNFDMKIYGFDSFEGLPKTSKEEDGYFEGGTFYTGLESSENFLSGLESRASGKSGERLKRINGVIMVS